MLLIAIITPMSPAVLIAAGLLLMVKATVNDWRQARRLRRIDALLAKGQRLCREGREQKGRKLLEKARRLQAPSMVMTATAGSRRPATAPSP